MIDLHTHSTYSDGTLTPSELVKKAAGIDGLTAIALTDHNTTDGLNEFQRAGKRYGIKTVSGIEFSTETYNHDFHVLALFVDENKYGEVNDFLSIPIKEKIESNKDLVKNLNTAGINIDYDTIVKKYGNEKFNRVAIANELIDLGFADSIQTAFEKYLLKRNGFYNPSPKPNTFETIKFIKQIGCAAVLAHGLKKSNEILIDDLEKRILPCAKKCGLDGMEVMHPSYNEQEHKMALRFAKQFDLIETGGSDFHGKNKPDIELAYGKHGEIKVADNILTALEKRR